MKKLLTLFLIFGAFCACQMSEFDDFMEGDAEFFAKIEDTQLTKTLMDENNNVLWSAGDQLMIFRQSTLGVKYQVQSKYVGKNHGGFSRVAGENNDDFYAGIALDHNVAYYPYVEGLDCSNANSNVPVDSYLITGVVLPQTQTYAQESFGNGAFPMLAVSLNKELTFRNVCGGMKLQLKGNQKVTSIAVKGNDGEKLAGKAVVTAFVNGSNPVIEMCDSAYTSVVLDCAEGVQLDEKVATSFIIALPPVEFSKGFEVTVTDAEGNTNTITTDVQNTVLRSSLLTMPAINVSDAEFGGFNISLKEFGSGRILLNTTVTEEREFAYIISEEPLNLSQSILFIVGSRDVLDTDGEYEILTDLKEHTKYYLYVAAKLSDSEYSELIEIVFETEAFEYNELCSLTAVMYDGFKMHVSVPESVMNSKPGQPGSRAIRYTMADLMTYNNAGSNDYYYLLYNGNKYLTEDADLEFSEELNYGQVDYDINEDGVIDENDMTYLWNPISPGEPVVFLAGEFEWMTEEQDGLNGFEYPMYMDHGYYLPCMNNEYIWTGAFQKKVFETKKPSVLNAEVKMEIEDLGPVDATLVLTPDPSVQFYSVMILDEETYNWMLELLEGKEEYLQWATASFFSMYNFGSATFSGPVAVSLSNYFYDVPVDTNYHVLITGMGDDKGSKQCFNHYQFRTPQKTKANGPTIVVEPLEAESSPFEAKFRIKCASPDNPAVRCYYGSNYLKEWIYEINGGGTYLQYGQTMQFSSYELKQINSEEGLVISLPSIDGETTRLVVVGYNDENTPNNLNYEDITECPAVADLTTPYYEAQVSKAYYQLADALSGDWVMSAVVADYNGNRVTQTHNVSILKGFDDYPAATPQEVYDIYRQFTKLSSAEIDGIWTEFREQAQIFNERRLEYQNKLALVGWFGDDVYGPSQKMMPYDLLITDMYNAVDVKSMFSDFGPKMFIEIADGANGKAKLTITADMMYGVPVSNWYMHYYLAGRADLDDNNTILYYSTDDGSFAAPLVFDVEYTEDFKTLTIKPIVENRESFYPNLIYESSLSGMYYLEYPIVSDVTLTKGITKSAVGSLPPQKNVSVDPLASELKVVHKQHTRFEKPVERKKVSMEVMTLEKAKKNVENYIRKRVR